MIKLVVTLTREFPSNFDLTDYYDCVTVEDAAKLDKEMLDDGRVSLDEYAQEEDVTCLIQVTREDTVILS